MGCLWEWRREKDRGQSCIPEAGSALGSRSWASPGIGLHCRPLAGGIQDVLGIVVNLPQAAGDCGVGSPRTLVFGFRKWVPSCPRGHILPAWLGAASQDVALACPCSQCSPCPTGPFAECHLSRAALRLCLPRLLGQAGPSKREESPQPLPPLWESWIPGA